MNEQLTSDELRQVLADWIRPMYTRERRKIAGLFEAVIARAEAAEADNRRLAARVAELEAALVSDSELDTGPFNTLGRVIAERNRLAARVAELESQAAQQWRPVTEKPTEPPDGETSEYLTWNDFVGFTVRRYRDGQFHSAFRKQPTHWRPLPPAPNEAEEVQP